MKKRRYALWTVVPFFAMLVGFLLAGVILQDATYCAAEKRNLQQRPINDFNRLTQVTEQWTDYMVDQFPMRDTMLAMYTRLELAQGKVFVRNAYVGQEDYLMTYTGIVAEHSMQAMVDGLDSLSVPVVLGILPMKNQSIGQLTAEFVDHSLGEVNHQNWLKKVAASDHVVAADVTGYFQENYTLEQRMEFYPKGDYHWNGLGAYTAMTCLHETLLAQGLVTAPLEAVAEQMTWQDFTGEKEYLADLNNRFSYYFSTQEDLPYYALTDWSDLTYYLSLDDSEPVERQALVAKELEQDAVSYIGLYTDNEAYYRVENPNGLEDLSVLVVKDSYQNPTIDYFSALFTTVQVVDPRAWSGMDSLEQLVEDTQVDLVISMYNQNWVSQELLDLF